MDYTKCHTTLKRYPIALKPVKVLSYDPKRFKASIYRDASGSSSTCFATTPTDLSKLINPDLFSAPLVILGPHELWAACFADGLFDYIDVIEYIQD